MKKNILIIFLTSFFFVLSFLVTAQPQPQEPVGPGGNVENPNNALGGGAPIGGGVFILLGLAAVYGGRKVYKLYDENKKDLDD